MRRVLRLPLGPRKAALKAIAGLLGAATIAPLASPDSYTPGDLAQKILTTRSAL